MNLHQSAANASASVANFVKRDPLLLGVMVGSVVPHIVILMLVLAGPGAAFKIVTDTILDVMRAKEFGGLAWIFYAVTIYAGLAAVAATWLAGWPAARQAIASMVMVMSVGSAFAVLHALGTPIAPTDWQAVLGAYGAVAVLLIGGWNNARRIWSSDDWRAFAVSAFSFR